MKKVIISFIVLILASVPLWGLNKYRGANFISFGVKEELGTARSFRSLDTLKEAELNTLVIPVTWFQNTTNANTIFNKTNGYWQTPSDEALSNLLDYAKELGLTTVIKLHVNVTNGDSRTLIEPAAFNTWWSNYKVFADHYAVICRQKNVDIFIIGTELKKLAGTSYLNYWKVLAQDIRKTYSGSITYSANWDNYQNVSFWSEMDIIGLDVYFPLIAQNTVTIDQIEGAWQSCQVIGTYYGRNWLQELRNISVANSKHVLFTEIGYCSTRADSVGDSVLAKPWGQPTGSVDMEIQAKAYAGFIKSFLKEDWFEGFFIWDWRPDPDAGGWNDKDFTPQNKPALEVLKSLKYYEEDIHHDDLEVITKPGKVDYAGKDTILFKFLSHKPGELILRIYNKNYRKVLEKKVMFNDEQEKSITIEYCDLDAKISRGLYFFRIEFNDFKESGRFIIIK
ncbi:MAG: hypothetical protein KKH98_01405 [Spirochaetes bacterium]|nr:hypothetical protein [Spirochaetota bacterium]